MTVLALTVGVLLGVASAGTAAHAAGTPTVPPGLWSGGYGSLEPDAPRWNTLIAHIEVKDDRIEGTLQGEGRIRGTLKDGVANLSIDDGDGALKCTAEVKAGMLLGTCAGKPGPMTLRLIHEQEIPDSALESLVGVYTDADGKQLAIRKSFHLVLTDFATGAVRVLYSMGDDEFIAGERMGVPHPVGLRLKFARDAGGAVTGVSIQDARGTTRQAERCCPWRTEEFTFTNDDVPLAGSLWLPETPGPHPAVIFVHGSGPQTRAGAGTWPLYLVSRGFAVLAYDKRGQGGSGGNYRLPGGGRDNAPHMKRRSTDVLAAVRALKARRGIDPARIGLLGVSQAGWVMPMVAQTGEVAFTVTLSGGATELSVEGRFSKWAGEDDAGGDAIEDLIARLRGFTPDDYDFRPHFAAQKAPGLWLYGAKDRSNPSTLCIEMIQKIAKETGNDFTVRLFPDGNHSLMRAVHGGAAENAALEGLVAGLYDAIDDWLEAKGFTVVAK